MFFESDPVPQAPPKADEYTPCDTYMPARYWQNGHQVLPLEVTPNGDIIRSTDFGQSEFSSLREMHQKCGPFQWSSEYVAVFGALLIDKIYMLVAAQAEPVVKLPYAGHIWKVNETRWIPFELNGIAPIKMSNSDRGRLKEFQEYAHSGGYYFSDYVDLRQPFPFSLHEQKNKLPQFNCDWSEQLRSPFNSASLRHSCSVLIRGFAEERVVSLVDGSELHFVLLGRQSNLNPGPRYYGRGLNESNATGNDHTYEYILWKRHGNDAIAYARHVLLRGTVPVRWTTQTPSVSLSEPAMTFNSNKSEVLRGCDTYFDNTLTNLQRTMLMDTNGQPTTNPQLRCISLLRLNGQHDEDVLARYFLEGIRFSEPMVKQRFPNGSLDLVHVDWLNLIRDYGIEVATSNFWEAAIGFLGKPSSAEDSLMSVGMIRTNGAVDRLMTQSRFIRVNCADSLDRTNLGCFFTCIQVTIAMLLTLQVPFTSFKDNRKLPPLEEYYESETGDMPYSAAYAPVSGAKQNIPKPFVSTWTEARDGKRIPPGVVRVLAELFVGNGDCVAMLYTNSAAMHGNILRGVCGMKSGSHNAVIATQRKFENAFEDRKKFRNIELLLCRNVEFHFSSVNPVFLTRPVAYLKWSCALIALCVPIDVLLSEVEGALRTAWDTRVVAQLLQNGMAPIESSALCVNITIQHRNCLDADMAASIEQADSASPAMSDIQSFPGSDTKKTECIVVIEFDENLCSVLNAPSLLRQQGFLLIRGKRCTLAPYAYPVDSGSDSGSSMGGAVKHVGTSLKKGFKSLMRSL
ncbi:inositol 5'-phosphatase [Strigomonas culicis]|nr:inositol 5'-phosphatase [Strigomonas culicis]|eukprot:EPY26934.1 inositol 5'-phosphatase [Strigomonas culicis]